MSENGILTKACRLFSCLSGGSETGAQRFGQGQSDPKPLPHGPTAVNAANGSAGGSRAAGATLGLRHNPIDVSLTMPEPVSVMPGNPSQKTYLAFWCGLPVHLHVLTFVKRPNPVAQSLGQALPNAAVAAALDAPPPVQANMMTQPDMIAIATEVEASLVQLIADPSPQVLPVLACAKVTCRAHIGSPGDEQVTQRIVAEVHIVTPQMPGLMSLAQWLQERWPQCEVGTEPAAAAAAAPAPSASAAPATAQQQQQTPKQQTPQQPAASPGAPSAASASTSSPSPPPPAPALTAYATLGASQPIAEGVRSRDTTNGGMRLSGSSIATSGTYGDGSVGPVGPTLTSCFACLAAPPPAPVTTAATRRAAPTATAAVASPPLPSGVPGTSRLGPPKPPGGPKPATSGEAPAVAATGSQASGMGVVVERSAVSATATTPAPASAVPRRLNAAPAGAGRSPRLPTPPPPPRLPRLPLPEALEVLICLAEALRNLHRRGLTHGALTPKTIQVQLPSLPAAEQQQQQQCPPLTGAEPLTTAAAVGVGAGLGLRPGSGTSGHGLGAGLGGGVGRLAPGGLAPLLEHQQLGRSAGSDLMVEGSAGAASRGEKQLNSDSGLQKGAEDEGQKRQQERREGMVGAQQEEDKPLGGTGGEERQPQREEQPSAMSPGAAGQEAAPRRSVSCPEQHDTAGAPVRDATVAPRRSSSDLPSGLCPGVQPAGPQDAQPATLAARDQAEGPSESQPPPESTAAAALTGPTASQQARGLDGSQSLGSPSPSPEPLSSSDALVADTVAVGEIPSSGTPTSATQPGAKSLQGLEEAGSSSPGYREPQSLSPPPPSALLSSSPPPSSSPSPAAPGTTPEISPAGSVAVSAAVNTSTNTTSAQNRAGSQGIHGEAPLPPPVPTAPAASPQRTPSYPAPRRRPQSQQRSGIRALLPLPTVGPAVLQMLTWGRARPVGLPRDHLLWCAPELLSTGNMFLGPPLLPRRSGSGTTGTVGLGACGLGPLDQSLGCQRPARLGRGGHGTGVNHRHFGDGSYGAGGSLGVSRRGRGMFLGPDPAITGVGSNGVTPSCDVYSLGLIMWYLVSGQLPLQHLTTPEVLRVKEFGGLDEQLPFSQELPFSYVQLARRCWSPLPMQRPSIQMVLAEMRSLRAELLGARPRDGVHLAGRWSHHGSSMGDTTVESRLSFTFSLALSSRELNDDYSLVRPPLELAFGADGSGAAGGAASFTAGSTGLAPSAPPQRPPALTAALPPALLTALTAPRHAFGSGRRGSTGGGNVGGGALMDDDDFTDTDRFTDHVDTEASADTIQSSPQTLGTHGTHGRTNGGGTSGRLAAAAAVAAATARSFRMMRLHGGNGAGLGRSGSIGRSLGGGGAAAVGPSGLAAAAAGNGVLRAYASVRPGSVGEGGSGSGGMAWGSAPAPMASAPTGISVATNSPGGGPESNKSTSSKVQGYGSGGGGAGTSTGGGGSGRVGGLVATATSASLACLTAPCGNASPTNSER